MRKHSFEILVGILVATGVALVVATGYLSYKNISSIVENIHEDNLPDEKFSLISDIATNLDKAEGSIRLYAYTRKNSDLQPFREMISTIDEQLEYLKESGIGNEKFLANIDTVSLLIEQKVEVWNDMLKLNNTDVATQYLDTISEQLESKVESDSLRKNRGILKKLFKRQKKQEIDEEKIIREIEQVRQEDRQQAQRIKEKELKLAATSSQLTARLYNLINKLKADERAERLEKAEKADLLAEETYRWIGWFSLSATLAGLLVLFVISAYVKKTRASQKALETSKAEAENLAKTKELFVANVSHEIRTPMNVISGFVDQLLKKPIESSLAGTLKIIKSSSDHLVRIINDILDFSKLQSGKMKLEPVHFKLSHVLEEIRMLFENQAKENQSSFIIQSAHDIPETIFGDPVRLKQILINLISNAIKFTKKGKVSLQVNSSDIVAQNFNLIIVVEDTGIGISSEHIDKIFEDFTQAEAGTSRKFGGTGLGLSIVKKLVDMHQGTIDVKSEKHKGTQITCVLPYRQGDKNKVEDFIPGEIDVPLEIKRLRVLIVDDEMYNRMLMKSILDKWKIESEEAEDGLKAIEKINENMYDVVLLDLQMPGADGYEVADYIRNTLKRDTSDTALIFTTAASVSEEEYTKYKNRGVDEYLSKPFSEELLLKTLLNIFQSKQTPGEAEGKVSEANDNSKVINLDELYRFAANDQSFVREMLEKYIESFESGMIKVKEAISGGNHKTVSDTAHKLASPSRHIGANRLLEILKKAEQLAEEKADMNTIAKHIAELQDEYVSVKKIIEQHLDKLKN